MLQSYSAVGASVPSHVGTLAPPGEYDWTCASFGPPESATQTANRSLQPFLHSAQQKVPIFYNGRPFPPKLPLLMGDRDPHLIWFLWPVRAHNPNGIIIIIIITYLFTNGSAVFAQLTTEYLNQFSHFCTDDRTVSLYFTKGCPFPPSKFPLHIAGCEPPSDTWFVSPTQVHNPNGISIGSAVFAGLTSVTDQATRSVTIDSIYVHSTGDAA